MQESGQKKNGLVIIGLIVLIVALVVGVCLIFNGLGSVLPETEPNPHAGMKTESGQPSPYGMRLLEGEERQSQDIQKWMDRSKSEMADGNTGEEQDVFWLYRQNTDEYILYLPSQDRTLTDADITATEETEEDGIIALVLRARTPENGTQVVPEDQLLCIKTESEQWKGIRVKVILDGRERQVDKLASKEDKLYSTEELYIGRS